MRQTSWLLLELMLWATAVRAFFPWIPESRCTEFDSCHADTKRTTTGSNGLTFEVVEREPDSSEPLDSRVARTARRLRSKYTYNKALAARKNDFAKVEAAAPTIANAAGIDQDGTDFSYFVRTKLGASGKTVYMLLDTGAGTTWVMGAACTSQPCKIHNTYGPLDSTSFQATTQNFTLHYGTGSVAGLLATDAVELAGLKVSMSFGTATTTSDDFLHFPFDGILGMSMSKGQTDNFMQKVKATGALKANLFAVSLSRSADGPNTGEVAFGSINPAKHVGEIKYTAVTSQAQGDWAIPLEDMAFDGKKAAFPARIAYIDTGTTYIFGPRADIGALHKLIPGATSPDGVTFTVPCTTTQPITVIFSGVSYTISAKDWVSAPSSAGTCNSNLYGHEVVPGAWLLGATFIKNVYTVFDMDQTRIGFASKPAPPTTNTASPSTATQPISSQTTSSNTGGNPSSPSGFAGGTSAANPIPQPGQSQTGTPSPNSPQGSGGAPSPPSSGTRIGAGGVVSIICIVAAVLVAV